MSAKNIKIWFNHDGTNMLTCMSPFHKKGQHLDEEMIRKSFSELSGYGVDVIAFNPGNGIAPWWQSKDNGNHFKWFMERTGKKPSPYGQFIINGGDIVKIFCEECRKAEISPIISLRLKDEHGINKLDSEVVSKFFLEHQHLRIDSRPNAVFGVRGLNWIYPEVREERLNIIKELVRDYDIDGIELDFMRFPPFFDMNNTSSACRYEAMFDFCLKVREILDSREDRKMILAARVPNRIAELDTIGLNIEKLTKNKIIDVINISPSYVSQVESDIELYRKMANDAILLYELTHCTARAASPSWGTSGDDYAVRLIDDEDLMTAANLAYNRGANGISFFNFQYSRKYGIDALETEFHEPSYSMFKVLRDPKAVSDTNQHYWIPAWWKTGYHRRQFQLPKKFIMGTEDEITFDLVLPESGVSSARLRIMTYDFIPYVFPQEPIPAKKCADILWKVYFNGVELSHISDVSEPFGHERKKYFTIEDAMTAWSIPNELLRDGINTVKIKLEDASVAPEFFSDILWADIDITKK